MDDAPSRVVRRAIEGDANALEALWRDHRAWVASVVLASLPREAHKDGRLTLVKDEDPSEASIGQDDHA